MPKDVELHAKYRGWGMALLAAALRDERLTCTAFTPQPREGRLCLCNRFENQHGGYALRRSGEAASSTARVSFGKW